MSVAASWLPPMALGDARTAAPVARALGDWSADWLATGTVSAAPRWEPCAAGADTMGFAPIHQREGYRLLAREDASRDLAERLLGRPLGEREGRTRQDRAVLEHLCKAALAALAGRLDELLSWDDGPAAGEWFALPIAPPTGPALLRLEAARPVLVRLATAWARPPRRNAALSPRAGSFAAQRIRLTARIGSSRLALPQIEALGVGDVLTLETPLSAPVGACIDGKPAGEAALSLVPGREGLKLRMERPASQW